MTYPVSIWAIFPDYTKAVQAINLLECIGFRQNQIAIKTNVKEVQQHFDWTQAIYQRVPEGIIGGVVLGGMAGISLAIALSRGFPLILFLTICMVTGMLCGAVMGAFCGLVYARVESHFWKDRKEAPEKVAIGVRCASAEAEDRSKEAFMKIGATSIATENTHPASTE